MAADDRKEIMWPGDPIANWSIALREAREADDVEQVEQLINTEIQPGPSIPKIEGVNFPACHRHDVQAAMEKSVLHIASHHGFTDFDHSAVKWLSVAMANFMEDLCNHIRINRHFIEQATNRCSYVHAAAVTLVRTRRFSVRAPKAGLRGLAEWYDATYRKPALRAEAAAKAWLEWERSKKAGGNAGPFVEPPIAVDEVEEEEPAAKKARPEKEGANKEEEGEETEEDYADLAADARYADRVEEVASERQKEAARKSAAAEEKRRSEEERQKNQTVAATQRAFHNLHEKTLTERLDHVVAILQNARHTQPATPTTDEAKKVAKIATSNLGLTQMQRHFIASMGDMQQIAIYKQHTCLDTMLSACLENAAKLRAEVARAEPHPNQAEHVSLLLAQKMQLEELREANAMVQAMLYGGPSSASKPPPRPSRPAPVHVGGNIVEEDYEELLDEDLLDEGDEEEDELMDLEDEEALFEELYGDLVDEDVEKEKDGRLNGRRYSSP